ncbi:MAG: TetR/AcrR family transcriptional regulator [Planctomycetes bacterium]|nr:TetR/AcrR family transcriptional regulator [Planctomycetota bacterium]
MISRKPEQVFASEARRAAVTTDAKESYEDRLTHILEAATQVFAQVGYERASMRMVTKAARVSLAGVYHYVDSKERVLFLIQFRTFNSLLTKVRETLSGITDPVEQLCVMVRTHVNYFVANMPALKVCSHELDSLGGAAYDDILRVRREYYQLARGVLERLMDKLAPDAELDMHVATMSLFGTLNWLYRWYDPKRGKSPHAVARQITAQFMHGVLGAGTELGEGATGTGRST